ncbi:MAG: hypothetical protein IKD31_06070, partial [Clostridia bacterium]|nr:hypothetical protein [Clostridia bacterium]
MKQFSLTSKLISLCLAITIAVASLPMAAFALALKEEKLIYSPDALFENIPSSEKEQKREIVELAELRSATDKYFRLEDGSIYLAHYGTDVHYLDEEGLWQDFDNRLSVSGNEIATATARIKLAKKIGGNGELFTLHDGNRKLSLSLLGANKKVEGIITNHKTELGEDATKLQKMTALDHVSSSVLYPDILENADLEYVICGSDIKENIIVKAKGGEYTYSFTLSLNNLVAALNEKGEVIVSDSSTGEGIYVIPAPVMWDADGVFSESVTTELFDNGNGKYTLTLTASADWMNDENRAYPVTIDPPIYTATSEEAYLSESVLSLASEGKSHWKMSSLPQIPASAYITKAEFSLPAEALQGLSGALAVYEVLGDLTDAKAVSSEKEKIAEAFSDFQTIRSAEKDPYLWDVTPMVKKWYLGENYGLVLAPVGGSVLDNTAKASLQSLRSAVTPRLTIEYRDMKGVEGYWSFSSQSAGFAGTGSVNHATGNLVFSIPTLTTADALLPVTPSLVYNSALSSKDYVSSNAQTATASAMAPRGFKLNLNETLVEKSATNANGQSETYFVWADGDGTEHVFLKNSSADIYEDEDGLLLTLDENEESLVCTITDSQKTVRTFVLGGSGWVLSSIRDRNGNEVRFTLNTAKKPTAISLIPNGMSAIEQLRLAYNSDGDLYAVWNPASGEGVVFRTSASAASTATVTSGGHYLRRVIRAHGGVTEDHWQSFYNTNSTQSTSRITVDAVAEYTYDSAGYLTGAVNCLSQYKITYGYDASHRVSAVSETATASNTAGQSFTLSYGTSSAVIRTSGSDDVLNTSDDLLTTYAFDSEGRCVSSYTTDPNRTQIFGASGGQYVGEDNEKAKNSLKSSVQTVQQSSNYLLNGGFEEAASSGFSHWNKTGLVSQNAGMRFADHYAAALTVNGSTASSSLSQYVYLDKGDYTLSLQINSHEAQDVSVLLKAQSLANSAHTVSQEIPLNEYYAAGAYAFFSLNFSADPAASGGKERFLISITLQGFYGSTETVWIDNLMLSKTTGAAEYDSLSTGHFEASSDTASPQSLWSILDHPSTPITVVDSGIPAFGDVLKVQANANEVRFVQQIAYEIPQDLIEDFDNGNITAEEFDPILYTVSGWAKGTAQSYADSALFGIRVKIKYYDGSYNGDSESYDFAFDRGITDWQFIGGGFATNPEKGLVQQITVMLMYYGHAGIGYFDQISLVQNESTTNFYHYNEAGYLSSYQGGNTVTWYDYDANYNVSRVISTDKTVVEYEYDGVGRPTREVHKRYDGIYQRATNQFSGSVYALYEQSYQYNAFGQIIDQRLYDSADSTKRSYSQTAYHTAAGSHIFG